MKIRLLIMGLAKFAYGKGFVLRFRESLLFWV